MAEWDGTVGPARPARPRVTMSHVTTTRLCVLAAAAVLALAGCGSPSSVADPETSPADEPAILAEYGLAGLDGKEIVDRLERTPVDSRPDLIASVRPGHLLLSKAGSDEQTVIDLPDEFYLSVAPYRHRTHECHFHSLTTCRGELAGEKIHVTITNRDTGEVLVDEVTETFDNGFAGFWLPRGINATIHVRHGEYSASGEISTGPEDATCLTTLHLTPHH